MAPSSSMKDIQQGGVSCSISPVTKVCGVFNNKLLPSNSSGKPRTMMGNGIYCLGGVSQTSPGKFLFIIKGNWGKTSLRVTVQRIRVCGVLIHKWDISITPVVVWIKKNVLHMVMYLVARFPWDYGTFGYETLVEKVQHQWRIALRVFNLTACPVPSWLPVWWNLIS